MKANITYISTKLKMPVPRKNYIRRESLLLKLERALESKLTLIKGAAASGKTTLVASFISESSIKTAKWISLDKDNNDLFSFWYYFLEGVKEFLGEKETAVFEFFNAIINKSDMEKLIAMLINCITTVEKLLVVLDDFHNITDEALLKTIEYFIKNSPINVHIILVSREQPQMYLGDLVMSNELLEICEEELRFTKDEGDAFLKNTLKMKLEDTLISKINNLSEGWVGGLQLIALASANKQLKDIKVLNKYMVDYLSKEILTSLSEEEQNFLVKTSVLGYFGINICNELLEINNSGEIINGLVEKNLFLINIDENEGLFRYHNIFEEFLKLHFEKLDKEAITKVHLKAAKIFERLEDLDECIKHLLIIEAYDEASTIILRLGENPKGWLFLGKIPRENIFESRELTLQKFFYHYCNAEIEECKKIFIDIRERDNFKDMKKILGFAGGLVEDKYLNIETITYEDIESLRVSEVTKAILYLATFAFAATIDDLEKCRAFIERTIEIEKNNENTYIKYFALGSMAQIKEGLGDFIEAEAIYEEIFKMIDKYPILEKVKNNSYIGIIGIYLKSFQISKAAEFIEKSRKQIVEEYLWMESGFIYNLIEYKLLTGERKAVAELVNKLEGYNKYSEYMYSPIINFLILAESIDNEKLEQFVLDNKENNKLTTEVRLVYCRALIKLNKADEALKHLNNILENSRKYGIKPRLVEAALLKIQILNNDFKGNRREIINLILEAIHYSYENKIIGPYILEGNKIINHLLLLQSEKGKELKLAEKKFISELLGYMKVEEKDELLSAREKEVLEVLTLGASNKEIGEKLCISVSTVKTHIINIYSKLGVSNRVEALEKARELGVL